MARAITWQDVQAPGQAAALLASQNANEQITKALDNVANVGTGWRDERRTEATRAAAASIQNAADPVAAAAAIQPNWAVDPLAVSQAANARGQQLLQNKASEASIAASQSTTANNTAALEDRNSERGASVLAAPYIQQLAKYKGDISKLDIDLTHPEWNSKGGNSAYGMILAESDRLQGRELQASQLRLQLDRAAADKRIENFQSAVYSLATSREGLIMDPAEHQRRLEKLAKQFGVSAALVPQAQSAIFEPALQKNLPTQDQFETMVPGTKLTYKDVGANLVKEASEAAAQRERQTNALSLAIGGASVLSNSPFVDKDGNGLSETLIDQKLFELGHKVDSSLDYDDLQDRKRAMIAAHKGILPEQAAAMVMASIGRLTDRSAAHSEEANAMAEQFAAVNDAGGVAGVARRKGEIDAGFQTAMSKIQRANQELMGTARLGEPLMKNTKDILKTQEKRQESADAEDLVAKELPFWKSVADAAKAKKIKEDISASLAAGAFNY